MKKNNNINKVIIGIIAGSGIDDPKIINNPKEIEVDTPYGKTSDKLIVGRISDVDVVIIARHGRNHTIIPTNVPFRANIWALKKMGCNHILATTACGSLIEEIIPGDIVIIDQFIDFTKQRKLTFFEDKVIHTSMADPFCGYLRKLSISTAKELNIICHDKGTVITVEGPRFSTRAESRMFQKLDAHIVNMSSVPEVILAREAGICYVNIAVSTDYDCWREREEAVTWEKINRVMKKNKGTIKKLLLNIIPKIKFNKCNYQTD